jgi:hypothetical protein
MFLSDHQELWPMLIQKALAKQQGSYFAISSMDPATILENMTGFPTVEIRLEEAQRLEGMGVVEFLRKATEKNYLVVLRGKKDSDLYDEVSKSECFNVLNFYNLHEQSLILVSCSFIS